MGSARNVVRPLDGTGVTWDMPRTEDAYAWSPDDRLVLSSVETGHYDVAEILRVRNHRSGAVVARFDGLLDGYPGGWYEPVWETNDTFLVHAYSRTEEDDDGGLDDLGRETIRCRVNTEACEKVLPSEQDVWFVTRTSS